MWEVAAAMAVIGAVQGTMAGDAEMDAADNAADDLELEGERNLINAKKEGRDIRMDETLASGSDQVSETSNNISSGLSEFSMSNQMLAANRQAAMRESKSIIDEGERMNKLYKDRANTTRKVGKERAEKSIVNGIIGGAVSGYGMKDS